jgi:hypothetical protein
VITWLRKLNNKSDLFEPRRAPDPFGHLSKWARAEEREDKEERERKRDQNDREERKDRRDGNARIYSILTDPLFQEKKTLQKVITWLRKLNNKSDLFEPRRAPDPFGHLSKWALLVSQGKGKRF